MKCTDYVKDYFLCVAVLQVMKLGKYLISLEEYFSNFKIYKLLMETKVFG